MTDQPQDQPTPQIGDRVRVTRTRSEVFEGYWAPADVDDQTGNHGLSVDADDGYPGLKARGFWMRVRDQGPIDRGFGEPGGYLEADTFEIIEARHGAPFDDRITPPEPEAPPALSPALVAARRRFSRVFTAYLVFAFVAGIIVTGFYMEPLHAEFGRVGTAVLLVTVIAVLPAIPLSLWAHRNDRALKRETGQ